MAYPLSDYQHTLLANLSFSILSTWLNHWRSPSSILLYTPFVTPQNSLIRAFRIQFILLIPSKPLRLSICTALILDLTFSFHNIYYYLVYYNLNPTTAGVSAHQCQENTSEKSEERKRMEAQRAKHPSPSQATDTHIGDV